MSHFAASSASSPNIKVLIETLSGQKTWIEATSSDTVRHLKQKFFDVSGVPPEQTRLVFQGRELTDEQRSLASHSFVNEARVSVVFRLISSEFKMPSTQEVSNDLELWIQRLEQLQKLVRDATSVNEEKNRGTQNKS